MWLSNIQMRLYTGWEPFSYHLHFLDIIFMALVALVCNAIPIYVFILVSLKNVSSKPMYIWHGSLIPMLACWWNVGHNNDYVWL